MPNFSARKLTASKSRKARGGVNERTLRGGMESIFAGGKGTVKGRVGNQLQALGSGLQALPVRKVHQKSNDLFLCFAALCCAVLCVFAFTRDVLRTSTFPFPVFPAFHNNALFLPPQKVAFTALSPCPRSYRGEGGRRGGEGRGGERGGRREGRRRGGRGGEMAGRIIGADLVLHLPCLDAVIFFLARTHRVFAHAGFLLLDVSPPNSEHNIDSISKTPEGFRYLHPGGGGLCFLSCALTRLRGNLLFGGGKGGGFPYLWYI